MRTDRLRKLASRRPSGPVSAPNGATESSSRAGWHSKSQAEKARLEHQLALVRGCLAVDQEVALTRPARTGTPRFEDLALPIPDARRSRLDRDDVLEAALDADELAFRKEGFLIKEGFIPEDLTERYLADRSAIDDSQFSVWGGSYMALPTMREVSLYPPLVELLEKLIGHPLGLFLTLSGLRSSRREWHQDFYLKPGYENIHYCAVWIGVGDVDPRSGPYEYVPRSHLLPSLRKELVDEWLTPEERSAVGATRIAERFVTSACNDLIRERGLEVRQFVPRRGDVLVWHHSLLHQGSRELDPTLVRPGLIAHYNAVTTLESKGRVIERVDTGGAYALRNDRDSILSGRLAAQDLVNASRVGR